MSQTLSNTARFIVGDSLEVLRSLPSDSVDLVFTSPPFLALRSYLPDDHPDKAKEMGSEPTPGAYIDALLNVVEECARVLTPHGSLCVELGDTMAQSGGSGGDYNKGGLREGQQKFRQIKPNQAFRLNDDGSIKHEDRLGEPKNITHTTQYPGGVGWPMAKSKALIPELFRIALAYGFNPLTGRQTDRWRVRNVVTWARSNPPVGELRDKFRPATSDVLIACKSATRYFDLDAVRKPLAGTYQDKVPTIANRERDRQGSGRKSTIRTEIANPAGAPPLDYWDEIELLLNAAPADATNKERARYVRDQLAEIYGPSDIWEISPRGYSGAHFAVFPAQLVVDPIKSMCPERVCTTCGEPSRRVVARETLGVGHRRNRQPGNERQLTSTDVPDFATTTTTGFTDCQHNTWRAGIVLDPFGGSGTTGLVAAGHGRDGILVDLDERNADLARDRMGMFLEVEDWRPKISPLPN